MILPYYNADGITIYNADCRAVLPQLEQVDAIVTDPAYKIISGGNTTKRMMGGIFDPDIYDNGGELFATVPWTEWVSLAYGALANSADCYVMVNDKNVQAALNAAVACGLSLHNILVWDKGNVTPNRWYMKCCEFTLYFWKGKARNINDMGSSQLSRVPNPVGKKTHPTEKPVLLMRQYIENSTDVGGVVLDPFMGTGATLVAAKQSGRRAIGVELSKEYCDIAINRLSGNHRVRVATEQSSIVFV